MEAYYYSSLQKRGASETVSVWPVNTTTNICISVEHSNAKKVFTGKPVVRVIWNGL